MPSLLAIGVVAGLCLYRVFEDGGAETPEDLLLEYGAHALFVAALLLGVFLLGGSVTRVVAEPGKRLRLAILAGVYGVVNVFLSLGAVAALYFGRAGPFRLWPAQVAMQELRLGTALICLLLATAGLPIMRNLAEALGSARLVSLTRLAFGVMIAASAVTLAVLTIMGTMVPRRDPERFATLYLALDVASAVIFAGFGWYWLIVAKTVRERTSGAEREAVEAGPGAASDPRGKVRAFLKR